MRHLAPLAVLLLLLGALHGAEPTAASLLQALPAVPQLSQRGTTVEWHGQAATFTIAAIDPASGDPLAQTAIGSLRIERRLVAEQRVASLDQLPALVTTAQAGGVSANGLVLDESLILGACLRGGNTLVVPQGVLHSQAPGPVDRSAEVAAVQAVIAHLVAASPASRLDALGQRALIDVVQRLAGRDGGQALDEVWPSVARRVARHGWLRQWFVQALAAEAEAALAAAETLRPVVVFAGGGLRLEQVEDVFGRSAWVYRTPQVVRYSQPEATPEYLSDIAKLTVVIDLPPDAAPEHDAGKAIAAHSYAGRSEVASWTPGTGLVCDPVRWAATVSSRGRDIVTDAIPPHIRISDLHGDVAGLAVAKGLLLPAADSTHAAAERFLADAARLLPDAAHLDLIGEYLFTYVYPSPDAQHPALIGNKQIAGNVQQTVWQTCGNVTGGIMRGDCADIAELYHTITTAQGRNPVVIGLPEHAACAWAEQQGGTWHVYVLQTGPPLAFHDATLPAALGQAYTSFDPSMAFDANQVPLLLRFSGEVSRSSWQLSWRIFSDPAYARTMIDVQKDWHFQTYQRGIVAMRALIAAGDHDNANYRELAGLATATGQFALAVDYHRAALALVEDPLNRLSMTIELVGHLLDAGQVAAARNTAEEVLARLPDLQKALGDSAPRIGLDLAGTCLNPAGGPVLRDAAVQALRTQVGPTLDSSLDEVAQWLASPRFDKSAWDNDTGLRSTRGLLAEYVETIITTFDPSGEQPLNDHAVRDQLGTVVQRWLDGVAFHDVEQDSAVMQRYAAAGRWYAVVLGQAELDRRLDAATLPATAITHAKRLGGAAQVTRDLPWIRASVPYWYTRLGELFRRDRATLDVKAVARIAAHLAEARAASERLGLMDTFSDQRGELTAEVAALIAHDEPALRQVLHRVAERNDKDLRDDAAQWLGDAARFVDGQWYGRVLLAWQELVDYKPKYFWIAWHAALNHAPQQALQVAKLAAEHFADDPAFQEEYGFMRTLLAQPQPALAPPATVPAH